MTAPAASDDHELDGRHAWCRLFACLVLATLGGIGLWSSVVILPAIEADFGVDRGSATLPYFATMIGLAIGGITYGRLSDRFGTMWLLIISSLMLGAGYVLSAQVTSYWQFILLQAVMIGMLGASASFGPLVADISLWFKQHRGIAVSIVASGNYLAGALWPPILEQLVHDIGWRQTHMVVGLLCPLAMLPLCAVLRRRPNTLIDIASTSNTPAHSDPTVHAPILMQVLLVMAGLACCIAMSMPQVHIVAYCLDLGYGTARGAEMLSIMLGLGIVSRLASGWIADQIGGMRTLILGSALQGLALLLYLPFDGLTPLYIVSAIFGLSQGGIVPCYALIVRDYFPAREAGTRVSLVLMATVVGMAIGGWMSGEIYDLTGSYRAAFMNGIAWNLLNLSICIWLLFRPPHTRSEATSFRPR